MAALGRNKNDNKLEKKLSVKKNSSSHMFLQGKEEPEEMYVSAHDAGAFYKYDETAKIFVFNRQEIRKGFIQRPTFPPVVKLYKNNEGHHPILFAAKGSHGLWTAPGT